MNQLAQLIIVDILFNLIIFIKTKKEKIKS